MFAGKSPTTSGTNSPYCPFVEHFTIQTLFLSNLHNSTNFVICLHLLRWLLTQAYTRRTKILQNVPTRANTGPWGPTRARAGHTKYAKPFWKFMFLQQNHFVSSWSQVRTPLEPFPNPKPKRIHIKTCPIYSHMHPPTSPLATLPSACGKGLGVILHGFVWIWGSDLGRRTKNSCFGLVVCFILGMLLLLFGCHFNQKSKK